MKTYQIDLTTNNNKVEVTISGDLSLNNTNSIKQELLDIINKKGIQGILVNNIENLDLSILQMLIAIKNEQDEKGIPFTYTIGLNNEQKALLQNCGFLKLFF